MNALFLHKLVHWEYWPNKILYIPVYAQWFWYSLRARSFFFFNACNPSIKNGGFFNESKKQIYDLIPKQYYPKTLLIKSGMSYNIITERIREADMKFPLIAKPDIGLRGSAVKKIDTPDDLIKYAGRADFHYLIQEMIPFENEIGIFYVRFPGEKSGSITGIVAKEFAVVTGDGTSTIRQLLRANPRFAMQEKAIEREIKQLDVVLLQGETKKLVPYGNHARGAKFLDVSSWISPELTLVIDDICAQIPEFYFGRIDLMYQSWDALLQGRDFSIVEVNGAGSEPTHIYDPKHSIFFAWKELMRHIGYMFRISLANKKKGARFLTYKEGKREWAADSENKERIYNF